MTLAHPDFQRCHIRPTCYNIYKRSLASCSYKLFFILNFLILSSKWWLFNSFSCRNLSNALQPEPLWCPSSRETYMQSNHRLETPVSLLRLEIELASKGAGNFEQPCPSKSFMLRPTLVPRYHLKPDIQRLFCMLTKPVSGTIDNEVARVFLVGLAGERLNSQAQAIAARMTQNNRDECIWG